MSSGQSRVQSQPNATELSRCLALMPWNYVTNIQAGEFSPTNQWPCTHPFSNAGEAWKYWRIEPAQGISGSWVRHVGTGYCLDVVWASQSPGTSVIGFPCQPGAANQAWNRIDMGNGTFALQAVHSGQCLDVQGWGVAYWAGLTQWPCHLGPGDLRNQTFTAHGNGTPGYFPVAGYIDYISTNSAGNITVQGWAVSPQAPPQPLGIRTVVDGQVITPSPGFRYKDWGTAGPTYRPDVDTYFGGGYHNESGFSYIEPYVLPPGPHHVCVQAQSNGFYDTLGCVALSGPGSTTMPLLEDGKETAIELAVPGNRPCLAVDDNDVVQITPDEDNCALFTPRLLGGAGWYLEWAQGTCLTAVPLATASIAACGSSGTLIEDVNLVGDRFQLVPRDYPAYCLTNNNWTARYDPCSNDPTSISQYWYDPDIWKRQPRSAVPVPIPSQLENYINLRAQQLLSGLRTKNTPLTNFAYGVYLNDADVISAVYAGCPLAPPDGCAGGRYIGNPGAGCTAGELDSFIPSIEASIRIPAGNLVTLSRSRIGLRWNAVGKAAGLSGGLYEVGKTSRAQSWVTVNLLHEFAHAVTLQSPSNPNWQGGLSTAIQGSSIPTARRSKYLKVGMAELAADCLASAWHNELFGRAAPISDLNYLSKVGRSSCDTFILDYIRTNAFPTIPLQ